MAFFVAFASASLMPTKDLSKSLMTSLNGLALPVESYADTPSLSIAFFAASVGVYKSIIALLRACAASDPVTFCSASLNSESVVSSAD